MGNERVNDIRFCYACGTDKTYRDKRNAILWYTNESTSLVICNKCYCRIFLNPRRINIRGRKQIILGFNPRKGICSWCGKTNGKMDIHHIKYHDDPLRDIVELCASCHAKETRKNLPPMPRNRLGRFTNRNSCPKDC